MTNYLLFFGKSSEFTTYAFNEEGLVPDFDRKVFKDFDLLETRFLVNDQLDNKIALAKYNFDYVGRKFSMLKIYGCAMAANADRISGSSYGIAFISENDISLSKENINLLNTVRLKFNELAIENNRFIETSFLHCVEEIWSVFVNAKYFQKIEINGEPFVSSNSRPLPFFVENFDGLNKVGLEQIKLSSKLYFTSDLGHIYRSIKYSGGGIPVYTISNGKAIEYREEEEKKVSTVSKLTSPNNEDVISKNETFTQSEPSLEIQVNQLRKQKLELEDRLNKALVVNAAISRYRIAFWILLVFFLGLFIFFFFRSNKKNSGLEAKLNLLEDRNSVSPIPTNSDKILILKNWRKELSLESVTESDSLIKIEEYNNSILKNTFPFTDKDGNEIKDKFVLKKKDSIPVFIVGKNGIIRRMNSKEKEPFVK